MNPLDKIKEIRKEYIRRRSNKLKREECMAAIRSNICPQDCENCAWYTGRRKQA